MLKRLFPSRWARIVAWTGAAVAWGTSVIAVQAAAEQATVIEPEPAAAPEPAVQEVLEPVAVVPAATEGGLVIIRYTPVPPPPPEIITRTVTVGGGGGGAGGGGGGGTTASSGGGSVSRPTVNVAITSAGS